MHALLAKYSMLTNLKIKGLCHARDLIQWHIDGATLALSCTLDEHNAAKQVLAKVESLINEIEEEADVGVESQGEHDDGEAEDEVEVEDKLDD
jgi:hypothetical protein